MTSKKAGRPTNYLPEYCQMVIDHMEQGKSFWTFGATLYRHTNGEVKAPASVLKDWLDKHPEFKEAKAMGETLSQDWLEEAGLTAMNQPSNQFNSTVWIFTMKNRCGWADKVEMSSNETGEKPGINISKDTDA